MSHTEIPDLSGKKILIVDDDPEVTQALDTALKLTKAAVRTVADGNAAVEACTADQPDLLILDMMLPKRSGFLVMEKIKHLQAQNGMKVVMITGNQGTRHKTYAETLGVDDYINKPFTIDRLMRSLCRLYAIDTQS